MNAGTAVKFLPQLPQTRQHRTNVQHYTDTTQTSSWFYRCSDCVFSISGTLAMDPWNPWKKGI